MRRPLCLPILALVALLVACGGGDGTENGNGDTTVPGTSTAGAPATSTTAPEATAPPTSSPTAADPGEADLPRLGAYSGDDHTVADPAFEALPGASAYHGTLGNAGYRVEIPDDWNGDLVLYAHGFRGFGSRLTVDSLPRSLRQELLDRGYAWAASSFSENGYAPGVGADDTLALRNYFVDEWGEPGRTYLVGVSMGGNVASLALEHHDGVYDGALALCGALGGQTQIDYLVSWVRLAEYFADVELPLGDGASQAALASMLLGDVSDRLGTPSNPTPAGEAFLSAVRELTGGPRPFFLEGASEQFAANFGLILADPRLETLVARAATNEDVVYEVDPSLGYDVDALNDAIVRQAADPEIRNAGEYPDKAPTSGDLSAPMLALHTTGDLFVPITQARDFADAADPEQFVARAIRAPGHCSFSDAEVRTAFDDLVGWVEGGEQPGGDDLSGDLSDIGRAFTDPIREDDPGTP